MLTSMLDILTTMLFFLLQNYSHVASSFNVAGDIQLPPSSSTQSPPDSSLELLVTKKAIILDDKELLPIVNGDIAGEHLYKDGVTIVTLAQALQQHKNRSKYVESRNSDHKFSGMIVLQADKDINYRLIKKVIYTAGITDYVMLKLAVLRTDARPQ